MHAKTIISALAIGEGAQCYGLGENRLRNRQMKTKTSFFAALKTADLEKGRDSCTATVVIEFFLEKRKLA